MKKCNLKDFKRGWIVGAFEPCTFYTTNIEVGVQEYKAGDIHDVHYHKCCDEINLVSSGSCQFTLFDIFNGENKEIIKLNQDEIIKIPQYVITEFKAETDCTIICIKSRSIKNDKYIINPLDIKTLTDIKNQLIPIFPYEEIIPEKIFSKKTFPKKCLIGSKAGSLTFTKNYKYAFVTKRIYRYVLAICECGDVIWTNVDSNPTSCRSCSVTIENCLGSKKYLYRCYKEQAAKRDISFELQLEDFCALLERKCHYCNSIPKNCCNVSSEKFFYNGVDRIDNNLGYMLSNCVSCCYQCNLSKSDYTEEEFLTWINKVFKYKIQDSEYNKNIFNI